MLMINQLIHEKILIINSQNFRQIFISKIKSKKFKNKKTKKNVNSRNDILEINKLSYIKNYYYFYK